MSEFSTPTKNSNPNILSPRKTINISRRSLIQSANSPQKTWITAADDSTSKIQRRRSKYIEYKSKQQCSNTISPLKGLSDKEMEEHYSTCVTLSTQNKINSSNAFNLHLIDYMADKVKKKDFSDFQFASTALDASSKIYTGRVDAIVIDTYKLLTVLGKTSHDKSNAGLDAGGANSQLTKKKRRIVLGRYVIGIQKKRKGKTIETNMSIITNKALETNFVNNAFFSRLSNSFDEGGCDRLFLSKIKSELVDGIQCLTFDSEQPLVPEDCDEPDLDLGTLPGLATAAAPVIHLQHLPTVEDLSKQICTPLHNFKYNNWNIADEEEETDQEDDEMDAISPSESLVDATLPCVEEDIGADEFAYHPEDNYEEVEPEEREEMEVEEDKEPVTHKDNSRGPNEEDIKACLAQYYNPIMLAKFVSPNNWKIPLTKPAKAKAKTAGTSARLGPKSKKKEFSLDNDIDLDMLDDEQMSQEEPNNKENSLKMRTLKNKMMSKNLSVDRDESVIEITMFFSTTTHSDVLLRSLKEINSKVTDDVSFIRVCEEEEHYNDIVDESNRGDDDDFNDHEFTALTHDSNTSLTQDVNISLTQDDNPIASSAADATFNMISKPFQVNKLNIDYAKVAKKVDMKKIKTNMWKILDEKIKNTSVMDTSVMNDSVGSNTGDGQEITDLSSILASNRKKLSKQSRGGANSQEPQEVSVHLEFMCLLHLANERNLILEDNADLNNIVIRQGNK